MLDDGKLTHNLCMEHFHEPLSDFLPSCHSTDVIEKRRAFSEGHTFLDLLDEFNAAEVHVVFYVSVDSTLTMDRFWQIRITFGQLTCSKKES